MLKLVMRKAKPRKSRLCCSATLGFLPAFLLLVLCFPPRSSHSPLSKPTAYENQLNSEISRKRCRLTKRVLRGEPWQIRLPCELGDLWKLHEFVCYSHCLFFFLLRSLLLILLASAYFFVSILSAVFLCLIIPSPKK